MASDHPQTEKIEALAKAKLDMQMGVRKELKRLTEALGESEEVLTLARGEYDGKQGLVVVTDLRVLFTDQGMMRCRLEDFPYDKISSVQTETKMMSGKLTLFASGNRAEHKSVQPKARVPEIGDYIRGCIGSKAASAESAPVSIGAAVDDPIEQLKKRGELRDAGTVSQEEFDANKAELLARL